MLIYSLADAHGVFCDAAAMTTDGVLIFASLWGRDSTIQALLGKFQLGGGEDGLDRLRLTRTDSEQSLAPCWIQMGARLANIDLYDKITGRVPKQPGDSVVGSLVHLFLFHKDVRSAACGYVLTRDADCDVDELLWTRFKNMQSLPLMDQWKTPVMDDLRQHQVIQDLEGVGAVRGWHIAFTDQDTFDARISSMIRSFSLHVPGNVQGDLQ